MNKKVLCRTNSGTYGNEAIYVTGLLLPVTPHSGHCLLIVGRIPVRVKHEQAVGSNQIQAAAASLAAQHEKEAVRLRVIESVNNLRSLLDGHGAIEPDKSVLSLPRELLEQVQGLCVIGNENHLVVALCTYCCQHEIQEHELAT